MKNNEKTYIDFKMPDGSNKKAEVLLNFNLTNFNKEYVIYTFGEKEGDLISLYTSQVITDDEGNITFENVQTDEEWTKIKDIMRKVIKENKE